MGRTDSGGGAPEVETACSALKHPIRLRIIELLDERDMSPSQFIQEGLLPQHDTGTHQRTLSKVAYHFRVLREVGYLEVVNTFQRRGATEHVYRGRGKVFHTDAEFARMPFSEREAISRTTLRGLIARADGAIVAGTFDRRTDRHLSWMGLDLDEQGWDELRGLQAESLGRAIAIKAAAAARIEAGAKSFKATFGALAFESPDSAGP